jgi:hypothetical protein
LVQPHWAGLFPVCRLIRVGEQTGAGEYAELNRIPWLASFAMFGVWMTGCFDASISGCIWQERPFHAWSSDKSNRKFGSPAYRGWKRIRRERNQYFIFCLPNYAKSMPQ